jgi:hypothetical protein
MANNSEKLTKTETAVAVLIVLIALVALISFSWYAYKWIPNEKSCLGTSGDCQKKCLEKQTRDEFDLCLDKCKIY